MRGFNLAFFIYILFFSVLGLSQSINGDSLRNPYSQNYLSDLSLRKVAKLIVEDSIQPSDNDVTFAILDSVTEGNDKTREYFVDAFNVILEKSDGALSEVMGTYLIKSIKINPNELLRWLSSGRIHSINSVAEKITYEIVMSPNPKKELEKLEAELKSMSKNTEYSVLAGTLTNQIKREYDRLMDQ